MLFFVVLTWWFVTSKYYFRSVVTSYCFSVVFWRGDVWRHKTTSGVLWHHNAFQWCCDVVMCDVIMLLQWCCDVIMLLQWWWDVIMLFIGVLTWWCVTSKCYFRSVVMLYISLVLWRSNVWRHNGTAGVFWHHNAFQWCCDVVMCDVIMLLKWCCDDIMLLQWCCDVVMCDVIMLLQKWCDGIMLLLVFLMLNLMLN